MDFRKYLLESGIDKNTISEILPTINSWADLHAWLDKNQKDRGIPKINRLSIGTPVFETNWKKNLKSRFDTMKREGRRVGAEPTWVKTIERRRKILALVSIVLTAFMGILTANALTARTSTGWVQYIYITAYVILIFYSNYSFLRNLMGYFIAQRGSKNNPWHPQHTAQEPTNERVAILFPVFHEDAQRVGAGLASIYESFMEKIPHTIKHYDFFILSDSKDDRYLVAEQSVIYNLNKMYPDAKIYYRHRASNTNSKLGNVVDFCRRWGNDYDHMFMMDADSICSAEAIHTTLRMMCGNERIGILQTNPTPILRKSFFGRMQQFSGRLYGSVFNYSLQAMSMGHANYIGHNAMIRMRPFIEHCMLPELSGVAPWGGKPLSHDIIEAALMARGGYEVWFLPEIEGSYEEIPANLLGFLIRERRWMQGNLQHLRFLFIDGLHGIHREGFINGLMGYILAPVSTVLLTASAVGSIGFMKTGQVKLNVIADIEAPTIMLLIIAIAFMFFQRVIALVANSNRKNARKYGGIVKMVTSMFIETVISMFISPIIMIFISVFLWKWWKRKSIVWGTQQRDDSALTWSNTLRNFGSISIFGLFLWTALFLELLSIPAQRRLLIATASKNMITPASMMLWFTPVLGGISLSVLLAQITSRTSSLVNNSGLFTIPEEVVVPREITNMLRIEKELKEKTPNAENSNQILEYATKDTFFYINHRHEIRYRPHIALRLIPKIMSGTQLTAKEWGIAIRERECFDILHEKYSSI